MDDVVRQILDHLDRSVVTEVCVTTHGYWVHEADDMYVERRVRRDPLLRMFHLEEISYWANDENMYVEHPFQILATFHDPIIAVKCLIHGLPETVRSNVFLSVNGRRIAKYTDPIDAIAAMKDVWLG